MIISNKEKNIIQNQDFNVNYSTWLEIDKSALLHNVAMYKNIIKPSKLAAVIKSNAYGHGIELISQILEKDDNVDLLCPVSLSEALLLRKIGITKPILVLSIIDGDIEQAIEKNIELVIYDINFAKKLNAIAKSLNTKVKVHLKIDTGLSRLGFLSDSLSVLKIIHSLENLKINGIFTHFAESENSDQSFTDYQIEQFDNLIQKLEQENINIPFKHTSCSAAITANLKSHYNVARVGLGLYGLWPSEANKIMTKNNYPNFYLKPVLTWKTRIIQIKQVKKGSFIGYDRTYQVDRDSTIAILPVGYYDGYDRRLSNNGSVLINGQLAKVIGRVAMNLTMIDITSLNVDYNDEVILLGHYKNITADDIANLCQTINYEIVARINPNIIRVSI